MCFNLPNDPRPSTMTQKQSHQPPATRITPCVKKRRLIGYTVGALCVTGFLSILAWSGIEAFNRQAQPVPLAVTDHPTVSNAVRLGERPAPRAEIVTPVPAYEEVGVTPRTDFRAAQPATPRIAISPGVKLDRNGQPIIVNGKPWTGEVFDHRPIRPAYTRTMKTTAYSPDERSCGKWADGITASGKSVWMNGGRLVAADRKIPYGTILTVPGYNHGKPVQVWDRGGKIKGNRLDVLYPTHEIAKQWGVQDLPVVFWEFVETD